MLSVDPQQVFIDSIVTQKEVTVAKFARSLIALSIVLAIALIGGCTEKQRAKQLGGSMTVRLECGQKLFDVTWKNDNLWYATRPMRHGEVPETYTFIEDSSFGVMEGKVTFVECR